MKLRLIAGANALAWVCAGAHAQTLSASPAPEGPTVSQVVVTAQRGYAAPLTTVGGKLPTDVLDVPQAVQTVTGALIRDQGITGFDEVLKNASGVSPASSPAEHPGEFRVRGFSTDPLLDGEPATYGFSGGAARDLFVNLERVEVLKGPAAISFSGGQAGGLGGVINLVSKSPLESFGQSYGLTVDSHGYVSPSVDLAGPLNASKTALVRLTGQLVERGSFINHLEEHSAGLYPTLLLRSPNERDTLMLRLSYTVREGDRYFGVPAFGTVIATGSVKPPYGANYNEPSAKPSLNEAYQATAAYAHRFDEAWSGHVVLRAYAQRTKDEGAYATSSGADAVEADGRTLDRQYLVYREHDQDFTLDAYLAGRFRTFGLAHELVVGVTETNYQGKSFTALGDIAPIDLVRPVYGARPTNVVGFPFYKDNADYYGGYAQDVIAIGPRLKLTLGGRYQAFRDFIREDDNVDEDRTVTAFTPRAGATYALSPGVVAYVGYAQGLRPTFATFRQGVAPEPERSEQVEGGFKLDLRNGLQATVAVFDLVRKNASVPDPDNPRFSIQAGEQEATGGELDVTWSGPDGVSAYVSYGYTDARITRDRRLPIGDRLQNTPRNAGRVFVTWAPPAGRLKGWRFGGGLHGADTREGTLPNSYRLPGYLTFDALIARDLGRYSVQLNLKNLTDRRYYASTGAYQEGVFPGEPFTAQVSLRAAF